MDYSYISVPNFALPRHGTVVVRLKTDVTSCCRVYPVDGCPNVVHRVSRCEQCSRTRLNKKYSDRDSDTVGKCRPYRTRAARSRYVNVCAAVCLLLLVGGLTPSAAAPHRNRKMEHARRSSDDQEDHMWANPCDYNESDINKPLKYSPNLTVDVKRQAESALSIAEKFQDEFSNKTHNFKKFEDLLQRWYATKWLQDSQIMTWHRDEVLPEEKVYNTSVSDEYLEDLMKNIDEVLPKMYKSLKMVVAAMFKVSKNLRIDSSIPDDSLKNEFVNIGHHVRAVLCVFSDVMRARQLTMLPLYNSEIPQFTESHVFTDALLVYRDTLNFLQYIVQVFDKMSHLPQE